MTIEGMNHFTILTDDVSGTVSFYHDVLGLSSGPRPNFDFPGAWLYAGGAPILHIIGGRPREALKAGVIDHMAFSARGLATVRATLRARAIEHECRKQKGSGVWQVFFFDPNGAKVELDFEASESET
jgi:catechol 2,3-dioxygenase-like lactoylglutathione lyase family enzyme